MQSLVRLVLLPAGAVAALASGDLAAASEAAGLDLPTEFLDAEYDFLWRYRLDQVTTDPSTAPWLVRASVRESDGVVVGHAGFHGPPDERGMVEIGYSTVSDHRGRGYAQSAVGALLSYASAAPTVRVVRACVSPENDASLAVVGNFGFELVGEQLDDLDGLELVLELPLR